MEEVKVSSRYQVAVPSSVRKQLEIEAGDRLLVDVQDGVIVMIPKPADFVRALSGLHREIWEGLDTDAYIEEQRSSWEG